MNRILKSILSCLVTVCLLATYCPIPMQAEELEEETLILSDEASLLAALSSEDTASLQLGQSITVNDTGTAAWLTVRGQHRLDLNGYTLTIERPNAESSAITIESQAMLTLFDTSKAQSGAILSDTDLFYVANGGSLTLDGGSYQAGSTERHWIANGIAKVGDSYHRYNGYVTDVNYGSVIRVEEQGSLTVCAATLRAHGYLTDSKPASVCVEALDGSSVRIEDGIFYGLAGADVFAIHENASVSVYAGEFDTEPITARRAAIDFGAYTAVTTEPCEGRVALPLTTLPSPDTAVILVGGVEEHYAVTETLEHSDNGSIQIFPTQGGTAQLTATGLRNNRYRPGNAATIKATYSSAFTKAPESLSYAWYMLAPDGATTVLPTKTETLNVASIFDAIAPEADIPYVFFCVITERRTGSHTFALTSISQTITVTPYREDTEIASVSLIPSAVGHFGRPAPGALTLSVSDKAGYTLTSAMWYSVGETESLGSSPSLESNRRYSAVLTLKAKNGYYFTGDTRISSLEGSEDASIAVSADGTEAIVTLTLLTDCSHESETVLDGDQSVTRICTYCGYPIATEKTEPSSASSDVTLQVTPPTVAVGNRISSTRPTVSVLSSFTVTWYRNGQPIGSFMVSGKTISQITDLSANDGLDFATAKFQTGNNYFCLVTYTADSDTTVSAIHIKTATVTTSASYPGAVGGFGLSYSLMPTETVIRHVSVQSVNPPKSGYAPDLTASLPADAPYQYTSLLWSLDSDRFYCGNAYTLTLTLTAKAGYRFAPASQITASVNGYRAVPSEDGETLTVSLTYSPPTHIFGNDSEITLSAPSCRSNGTIRFPCRYCSVAVSFELPACNGTLIPIAEKTADCTHSGLAAHVYCADCHTLFRDTDRSNATTVEELLLAPSSQAHISHDGTLVMNAVTHYYACAICGDNHESEAPHTFGAVSNGSVTCTVCGYTEPIDGMPEPPVSIEGETEPVETTPSITEPIVSQTPSLPANLLLFAAIAVGLVAVLLTVAVILAIQLLRKRAAGNDEPAEDDNT